MDTGDKHMTDFVEALIEPKAEAIPSLRSMVRQKHQWTAEQEQKLRDLVAAKKSAAEIGAELGVTRNAVIGKTHRMGIGCHSTKNPLDPEVLRFRREQAQRRKREWAAAKANRAVRQLLAAPVPEIVDDDIPAAQRRTLFELTDRTCRWPCGEPSAPDFFFCGADPAEDKPYCATHWRRAHRV